MENLNEFIKLQTEIENLCEQNNSLFEKNLPDFKKFFYYNFEYHSFYSNGRNDEQTLFVTVNFFIPDSSIDKNSMTQISFFFDTIFSEDLNKIKDTDFKTGVYSEDVCPLYSFFLVNQVDLEKKMTKKMIQNYLFINNLKHVTQTSFDKMLSQKTLILEKSSCFDISFGDFLLTSNEKFTQSFFNNDLQNILNKKISDEINNKFQTAFIRLITSLKTEKNINEEINTNKFNSLLSVVKKHDINKRFSNLDKILINNNNTSLKKKI